MVFLHSMYNWMECDTFLYNVHYLMYTSRVLGLCPFSMVNIISYLSKNGTFQDIVSGVWY